jgi:hypothetical protein
MTLTLLEAGEKAVNPPLVATQEAIRSDVAMFAGGITWVDAEYDEKLGEALRPMTIDSRGMPHAMEMRQDVKSIIMEAFYLNKLNLPVMAGDMTATEVSQRVQEYIRNALPLFGPMETEYNGAICEATFDILLRNGAFGGPDDIPDSIKGANVQFRFESPLHEAIERKKGQKLIEAKGLLAQVADLDPASVGRFNARVALKDALEGIGTPAEWLRSDEEMDAIEQAHQQAQQAQQTLALMTQGGMAAKSIGEGASAIQGIGAV